MESLEKKFAVIEEKKKKLKAQEKAIKMKEKRAIRMKSSDFGNLIIKAGISHISKEALFGALLEISEKINNAKNISEWEEKSKRNQKESQQKQQITISFKSPPNKEAKEILKQNGFKWNKFRGEYYGFGLKENLSEMLKGHECILESLN
jgi:hypothetical protein